MPRERYAAFDLVFDINKDIREDWPNLSDSLTDLWIEVPECQPSAKRENC